MAFSATKNHPFRVFWLYRSTGRHAAPRGTVPPRPAVPRPRRAAHAASGSRAASTQDSEAAQV
jgi:hypothetical protein